MPYIKKENRPKKDPVVEKLKFFKVGPNTDLEEILFRYCKEHVTPSYNSYKNYIGELNECAAEINRRLTFTDEGETNVATANANAELTLSDMADVILCMKECDIKADGDLNYVLFKYCKENMTAQNAYNFADGLGETVARIRNEILASYEESKIAENGDV